MFQNVLNVFQNFRQKLSFQYFGNNVSIGEHGICHFSTHFLGCREIAQRGGKILPTFYVNFLDKNFTKIETLDIRKINK